MMYKIELTQEEIQALSGLLDAGVRATGLRSCTAAAVLLVKLEAALNDKDDDKVVSKHTGNGSLKENTKNKKSELTSLQK